MAILIFLSGCQSSQRADNFSNFSKEVPASSKELKGTLRISTYHIYETVGIAAIAKDFMRIHPDVTIEIEEGISESELNSSDSTSLQRYAQELAVELMSGEGPDIIADMGLLSPRKFSDSGLFENLYDYMKHDPEIHMEDFYQNVLEALEYDGKLYNMPATFTINAVFFNRSIIEQLGIDLTIFP